MTYATPHRLHTVSKPLIGLTAMCGLLLLSAFAHAEVKITLDVKDGDKISDVTKLVAHVDAGTKAEVDKVEFQVDDQLRATSTSVPYFYQWDTIADPEGKHTVTITAYDSENHTGRIKVSLEIDNELGQGADALALKAQEALSANDTAGAQRWSRRALKADPTSLSAGRVLANIYMASNDYDKAIAAMEKAKGLESNPDALRETASYGLHRALLPANAATFFTDIETINDLRKKAANLDVETVKQRVAAMPDAPARHESLGDAFLNAGRIREAIGEYERSAVGEEAPLTSVNRLALALIYDNRPQEAINLIRPLEIAKREDAVSRALVGLAYLRLQQFDLAASAVKADAGAHLAPSLIVASYADSTLDKHKEAIAEANDAITLLPKAGEAQYALSMALLTPRESENALYQSLALSPFQSGPLLDYAARVALQNRSDRYDAALNLTDLVLKAEPQNFNAKLLQAILYLQAHRDKEAEPILIDLRKRAPQSPDVLAALSAYWGNKNDPVKTEQFAKDARTLDVRRFDSTLPLRPLELIQRISRKWHYRADFFLTPAALYPVKPAVP